MSIETDKESLEKVINKQADTIKRQKQELATKQAELEKMRSIDISKNKDMELLRSDIEGYKTRATELEELERIRVRKLDFSKASDMKMLYTDTSLARPMFLQLRKAIDADEKYRKDHRSILNQKHIVFETDKEDTNKIVKIYFEGSITEENV